VILTRKLCASVEGYSVRFLLGYFCFSFGFVTLLASGPPKKLAISNVGPVQENRLQPGAKERRFTQQVDIQFNQAVPNADDISPWNVTIYVDDGSIITLRGKMKNCSITPPVTATAPCWGVTTTDGLGVSTTRDELPVGGQPVLFPLPKTAILTLPAGMLSSHVTSILVSFKITQLLWSPTPAACVTTFCAASSKNTSDNYLSGLYSPAIHSAAQYSIDAQGSFAKEVIPAKVWLGAIATISTDNRPTADPDSFLVSGLLEWVPKNQHFWHDRAQGVLVDWDFAGLEFDRKTTTKTFISSPVAEIPLRIYPRPNADSKFSLGLFPYVGFGTGTNLSNALNSSGSGFVFRGLAGISASFTAKTKWKWLSQIGVTSNYTARIPALGEIFTDTHFISATGKTVSLYNISTKTRNHVKNQLDFTVAKPLSITVKHEYGELPPGFRRVDNKVSIGLTLMLQQGNTAHSQLNPEQ
jgi:hypothetical protein